MTKKARTASEKFAMIQNIEAGHIGVQDAVQDADERFGITKTTITTTTITKTIIAKWRRRYRVYGLEGLEIRTPYRQYSA
ncbi:hypothetical protein D3C77_258280 [compost metagenome]